MTSTSSPPFFFTQEEDSSLRIDKLLHLRFPECSRTYFQSLIEKELVLINKAPCKKRHCLQAGDEVLIHFELTPELALEPENIPLDILFEDEDLLIINKPPGMVVHPAPGHFHGTFVHALLFHCKSLEWEGETLRPGIVHRLDKDTSGVLLAAKNTFSHRRLVTSFSERSLKKLYQAICIGAPKEQDILAPIARNPKKRQEMTVCSNNGKPSHTRITSVLPGLSPYSHLELDLITGRTHQIRVHLQHIKCPILGDPVYGLEHHNKKWNLSRQMLHAEQITFSHPRTGEQLTVRAPRPQDFQETLHRLFPERNQ